MRKIVRVGVTLLAASALVVTMGGVASAKTVSNEKYAKQLCGQLDAIDAKIDQISPSTATDAATKQKETLASVDALIASLRTAQSNLKKLAPSSGGKKVATIFDKYFTDLTGAIQKARDTYAAADPRSPAFIAADTVLGASLSAADAVAGDPFSKLTGNNDLLGAMKDEKSCKGHVTVFG